MRRGLEAWALAGEKFHGEGPDVVREGEAWLMWRLVRVLQSNPSNPRLSSVRTRAGEYSADYYGLSGRLRRCYWLLSKCGEYHVITTLDKVTKSLQLVQKT